MNAQQLNNSILQELFIPKEDWKEKELKDIVSKQCPISYGIVQQGNHVDGGVPVVRPVDLHCKYVGKEYLKCTSQDISESYSRTVLRGDEILLCVRGTTGIMALAKPELKGCNVNRGIVPLFFDNEIDRLFVYYQLQTPRVQEVIASNTMGSALRQINIKDLRKIVLSYPPLAEQKRIVAKIEELMPKVEEYGKAQEKLNKLNEELPEKLKKSILQEAIEGRLVPQDPNDEPASALLAKIREEKKQLVKEGKLVLSKPEKACKVKDSEDFPLPSNWQWAMINDVCRVFGRIGFRGYTKGDLRNTKENAAISISPSNMVNGTLDLSVCTFISEEKYEESPEIKIKDGDILIVKTGSSYGKTSLVTNLPWKSTINPQIAAVKNIIIDKHYLLYFFQSSYAQSKFNEFVLGTSIPTFSQLNLISMQIPLPPLAEQKRIVEKIEQLFKEIDKLKK